MAAYVISAIDCRELIYRDDAALPHHRALVVPSPFYSLPHYGDWSIMAGLRHIKYA